MTKRFMPKLLILLWLALFPTCSDEPEEEPIDPDQAAIIISQGNIFATHTITAPSGTSVSVLNRDDSPHAITSASGEDTFDATGDFDVLVPAEGVNNFTLPEAPSGTVFYFYDRLQPEAMVPSTGTITIE